MSAYRAGHYVTGAELAEEALRVARSAFGDTDERTLTSLSNLALLYSSQGRYGEAEPLYEQALERRRETLGPDHPDTLTSLNNLAFLYSRQGRYGEAVRIGKGERPNPMMHGRWKSDPLIVPEKPPNKAALVAAEAVEGKGGAKGNAVLSSAPDPELGKRIPGDGPHTWRRKAG